MSGADDLVAARAMHRDMTEPPAGMLIRYPVGPVYPTGPVHARPRGFMTALCGPYLVTPTGGPWPPSGPDADEPICLLCAREAGRSRRSGRTGYPPR
jgi:hypothetical protein